MHISPDDPFISIDGDLSDP